MTDGFGLANVVTEVSCPAGPPKANFELLLVLLQTPPLVCIVPPVRHVSDVPSLVIIGGRVEHSSIDVDGVDFRSIGRHTPAR